MLNGHVTTEPSDDEYIDTVEVGLYRRIAYTNDNKFKNDQ